MKKNCEHNIRFEQKLWKKGARKIWAKVVNKIWPKIVDKSYEDYQQPKIRTEVVNQILNKSFELELWRRELNWD